MRKTNPPDTARHPKGSDHDPELVFSYRALLRVAVTLSMLISASACSDDGGGQANPADEQERRETGARELRLNEVAAGESPDWIELYNGADDPVRLVTFRLSDDPEDLGRGVFPADLTVEPGAFLRIDVDAESVGFALGGGESLVLSTTSGEIVDQVEWGEGQSPTGKSYGRIPDGAGDFKTLNTPTPGLANQDNADAAVCGDTQIDGDEQCDDGNVEAGDGCSPDCQVEGPGLDVTDSDIKVNEIMVLHSGDELDWVELLNVGQDPVNLAGWTMGDEDPEHIALLPNVVIEPGGFVVLEQDTDFAFGFNSADAVYLYDDAQRLVEAVDWAEGDMTQDMSLGRVPDGTGDFQVLTPSKGAAN